MCRKRLQGARISGHDRLETSRDVGAPASHVNLLDPSLQGFLWVLAIALTVIVLDVFFETELLSVAALLGVSVYFALLFDVAVIWKLLIALLSWLAVTGLFYAVWKRVFAPLIRRCLPAGANEAIHSAVGAAGEFRIINGKTFVQWNGDLWPVDLDEPAPGGGPASLADRQKVTITAVADGVFSVAERTPDPIHP